MAAYITKKQKVKTYRGISKKEKKEKKEKSKSYITKKKKPVEVIDTRVEFAHGSRPKGGWDS